MKNPWPPRSFTFLFILLSSTTWAQRSLPGTLVMQDNSTQTGKVYLGSRSNTPQTIRFINSAGQESVFGPDEVRSVEVIRQDGKKERYESHHVVMNNPSDTRTNFDTSARSGTEAKKVFLLRLISASQNGLLEMEVLGIPHFYLDQDSIRELVFKKYQPGIPLKDDPVQKIHYRKQLLILAYDYPELTARIQTLSYTEKAISQLLLDLNALQHTEVSYTYHPEKWKPQLFLYGGMTITDIHPEGNKKLGNVTPYLDVNYPSSYKPTLGAGYAFYIPNTKGKLWIHNDLLLRMLVTDNPVLQTIGDGNGGDIYVPWQHIEMSWFRLHTACRWITPFRKTRIFVSAGMVNGRLIRNKSQEVVWKGGAHNVYVPLFEGVVDKHELGYSFGLGTYIGHLGVEARYDHGNGFADFVYLTIPTSTLSILAHWRF